MPAVSAGLHTMALRDNVEVIEDNQPYNPYSEAFVLSHTPSIIRKITRLDQYRCASAGDDCHIVVWDIQSGEKLHSLERHSRPVTCMCVLRLRQSKLTLLSAASDKQIIAWDVDSGACLMTLLEHQYTVRCLLVLNHDNDTPTFCSGGRKICVWNSKGELLQVLPSEKQEEDVNCLLPIHERLIAAMDRHMVIYGKDEDNRYHILRRSSPHRETITSLCQINDSCFCSGSLDGTILIWSAQSMTVLRSFNCEADFEGDNKQYPYSIQYSLMLEQRYVICCVGCGIKIYDAICGHLVAEVNKAHYSKILHAEITYEGYLLLTCGEDGRIRLWGSSLCFINPGVAAEFSPLEKLLGAKKLGLEERYPLELELLGECIGHSGPVGTCVDFGKEGFVSCGMDGLLIIWKDEVNQKLKKRQKIKAYFFSSSQSGIV